MPTTGLTAQASFSGTVSCRAQVPCHEESAPVSVQGPCVSGWQQLQSLRCVQLPPACRDHAPTTVRISLRCSLKPWHPGHHLTWHVHGPWLARTPGRSTSDSLEWQGSTALIRRCQCFLPSAEVCLVCSSVTGAMQAPTAACAWRDESNAGWPGSLLRAHAMPHARAPFIELGGDAKGGAHQ